MYFCILVLTKLSTVTMWFYQLLMDEIPPSSWNSLMAEISLSFMKLLLDHIIVKITWNISISFLLACTGVFGSAVGLVGAVEL